MSEESVTFMHQKERILEARRLFNLVYETRDFDDLLNCIEEIIELHEREFGIIGPEE